MTAVHGSFLEKLTDFSIFFISKFYSLFQREWADHRHDTSKNGPVQKRVRLSNQRACAKYPVFNGWNCQQEKRSVHWRRDRQIVLQANHQRHQIHQGHSREKSKTMHNFKRRLSQSAAKERFSASRIVSRNKCATNQLREIGHTFDAIDWEIQTFEGCHLYIGQWTAAEECIAWNRPQ